MTYTSWLVVHYAAQLKKCRGICYDKNDMIDMWASYANTTVRYPIPHLHVAESPSQCMEAILAIFYTILTSYNHIP